MADRNDSSDEERQVRIKNLINEIKYSKGKGRRGKTKTSSNMTTEQDPGPVSGRVRTRGGRHKEHKVHFNWIHHTEHKNGRISYKQVRAKQGGGPREISYPIDQIQTVESLLNLGKSLYFPGGKSPLGSIDDMEFALSTIDGTPLEFQDRDRNMCSYQEYLKSLGIFSSNHYLYIRTKFVGSLVINDNVPETLNIKYCRYQPSFDGTMSYISARSIEACMSVHNEQIHDPNDVLESFIPESIQVGRKLYLDKNGENYVYPQSTNDAIIVHGPGTVCGTEDCGKSLILGVITTSHGKGDYVITWTLNNECISSGPNRYLIHITQPGEYNAQVQINGTTYTFEPAITVGRSNKSYSDLVENRELSAKSIEKGERIQEESAEQSPNHANNTIEHIQGASAEQSPNRANNTIEHIQEESAEQSPNRAKNTIEHIQEKSAERSPNRANNTIEHIQEESAERSPNLPNNTIEHIQEESAERSPNRANNTIEHIQGASAEQSPNLPNNTIEHIQEESAEQSPNRANNTIEYIQGASAEQSPNRANNTIEHIQEESAERSPNRANNTIEHIQEESVKQSPNRANNTIEHIQGASAEQSPNRANNTIEHIQGASAEQSPNRANNTIEHIQEESAERSPNRPNNTIEHIQEESAEQSPNRDHTDEPLRKKCKLQFPEESSVSPLNIQFDHFDLLDKIGEGGFGEVYKGRYLGTTVAVKKIKIKRMKLVKRSVLREVEVNSHIRHPNIVLLMGYSLQADHLYMITEMIQGPNLDDVLFGEQEITLNIDQKHNISKQVAQGISYLHNRSPEIIHRDIKPENILLSMSCETAKICDMGLSKLQNINTMQSTIINRNQMQPGTPAYQAPEVCVQLKSATKPADIWSLACTYTELYTEETIWDIEENDECSIDQIIKFMRNKEKPHGLYRLGGLIDIPCSIRKVITDGFSYNPDARPNALNICILFSEITK